MRDLCTFIRRQVGTDDAQGLRELADWTRELATLCAMDTRLWSDLPLGAIVGTAVLAEALEVSGPVEGGAMSKAAALRNLATRAADNPLARVTGASLPFVVLRPVSWASRVSPCSTSRTSAPRRRSSSST